MVVSVELVTHQEYELYAQENSSDIILIFTQKIVIFKKISGLISIFLSSLDGNTM
jgi:hypothetical protein